MKRSDTIYALSSAPGRAGVAVVRVSGPRAAATLNILTGKDIPSRRAVLSTVRSTQGTQIDQALTLFFAAPHSFTGEDVVEFHLHGSRAVLNALFAEFEQLAGLRAAEPGEFSRRAVENGKFDLTQAEAIADLVDAETEAQRRQALRQYGGALGALYAKWREGLIGAQALAEASIDFADEEIPEDVVAQAAAAVREILTEMRTHLDDAQCGELVRDGLKLAVIGPPNAGKSSLVNALVKREVAIVSPRPGTTRDTIEVRLNIGGYAFVLTDTAGLRHSEDEIEAEGVKRALAAARSADIILFLGDGTKPEDPALPDLLIGKLTVSAWNKGDLPWPLVRSGLRISAKTGEGIAELIALLAKIAADRLDRSEVSLTRPRHRAALNEAVAALERAVSAPEIELFAEDLRIASRAIGRIIGIVDVEDILDVVFRDFCIGK